MDTEVLWDYVKPNPDYPKICPSDMDREADIEIILNRWKIGEYSGNQTSAQAKRRGYKLNFHIKGRVIGAYVTITDLYLGVERRWYY